MKHWLTILALVLCFKLAAQGLPVPVFENAPEEKTQSGYIKLSWQWEPEEGSRDPYTFELQQSMDEGFEAPQTIYKGPDYATFLSGLKDGKYYYRIRVQGKSGSGWSEPVKLEVKHHSLQLAFSLFGLGALVFLITVGIVVQGNRSAQQKPSN